MIHENALSCTGCGACMNICPEKAIVMKYDREGFLAPVIERDKCIRCGKCDTVCQIHVVKRHPTPDKCYAAWSRNTDARKRSSSGAVFYELAKKTLYDNGIVCGAAMIDFAVRHILIEKEDDLPLLQGSKYVQSDLHDCFPRLEHYLKENRTVLFSGTPCQAAGLINYLGKDYPDLLVVDIVCHGVPSPGVFNVFLSELRETYGDFDELSFRDKENGWNWDLHFTLKRNGQTIYRLPVGRDSYLTAFLRHYILRQSCHNCAFATPSRCSDITLGDFWNIKSMRPDLYDDLGTSLVLAHTVKGENALEAIKEALAVSEPLDMELALKSNGNLSRPSPPHPDRKKFFDHFAINHEVSDWFDKEFNRVGILNFHYASNIGAVMVAWSLARVVNLLGYKAEIINFRPDGIIENDSFEEFRNRHIPQSSLYATTEELKDCGYRRLIVGSDQVWKLNDTEMLMLGWASGYKSLTSYAASFGDTEYSGGIDRDYAEQLLKRFDSISVREDSGVRICNQTFGVHAENVLDPTFLLPASDYEELIEPMNGVSESDNYVFVACYSDLNNRILNQEESVLSDWPRERIIDLWKLKNPSIGQLLWLIKNATYIVTDSFHMTAFSIIFNKKFISLVPLKFNGLDRIPSLLYGLGMKDRIRENLLDVSMACFIKPINYTYINDILERKKVKSLLFLKKALEKPILFKEPQVPVKNKTKSDQWKKFLYENRNSIPFFLNGMKDYTNDYYLFFFNNIEGYIHYELVMLSSEEISISLHFENNNITNDNQKVEAISVLGEKLEQYGFDYFINKKMIGIQKKIDVVNFGNDFKNLVYESYFDVLKIMGADLEDEKFFFDKYLSAIM